MLTKIASTYPLWLPPLPKKGFPAEWINLAAIESLVFDIDKGRYILRFSSGAYRQLEPEQAKLISEEFREMVNDRRSPPTPKKLNNPPDDDPLTTDRNCRNLAVVGSVAISHRSTKERNLVF